MLGFNKVRPEIVSLAEDLVTNHHNWEKGEYRLTNKLTNASLWINNESSYILLNDIDMFNRAEKKYLFNAICLCNILNALINRRTNND